MILCPVTLAVEPKGSVGGKPTTPRWLMIFSLTFTALLSVSPVDGQDQAQHWQGQVRKYAEAQDWESAMRLVDQAISQAPQDMDVRAWRARVLVWSGHLAEAEKEYLEILKIARTDPDDWMGLASVYLREGKLQEAQQAIDIAGELDPKRADLHAARARILLVAGQRNEAQMEFQTALKLDPTNAEARAGLIHLRGDPKHELWFGQDNDLLNFTGDYHGEWTSLVSQWTSQWSTNVSGNFYQRGGQEAGKFVGSVTRRQPKWGAVTLGGAVGHDNGVIPRSEAFFDLDRGWKTSETTLVRSVEFLYGQHWFWYQSARILTVNGGAIVYLPEDWTFSLTATGARSVFSGTQAEWRPSGITRLGFPVAHWDEKRLSGNVFFAAGTEDFAVVDQLGRFASQTYGGGWRFQITSRQDVTGYAGYQRRTQNHSDMTFGLSYGIHF